MALLALADLPSPASNGADLPGIYSREKRFVVSAPRCAACFFVPQSFVATASLLRARQAHLGGTYRNHRCVIQLRRR